jgi:hypothetical protein
VVPVIEGYLTLNLPIQSVNVIPACVLNITLYNINYIIKFVSDSQ